MSDDSKRELTKAEHIATIKRGVLGESFTVSEVEQEAELIETTLTALLDSHATFLGVTARFKR